VFRKLWFPLVALFWVAMNVLLWRSEMGSGQDDGVPVPAATVWARVITAPDDSMLNIFRHGTKIGYCRWVPRVEEAEDASAATDDLDDVPEGRVRRITGYNLSLDGMLQFEEPTNRWRFTWQTELGPRQDWRNLTARLHQRGNALELRADAAEEKVRLRVGEAPRGWEQTLTFRELAQPQTLLAALGLPLPFVPWQALLPAGTPTDPARLTLGLKWEARADWTRIGSTRVRVFRLKARLFDKYEAAAIISRVGEILRLDLPDGLVLLNEAVPVSTLKPE
jgi:hypothetical protein